MPKKRKTLENKCLRLWKQYIKERAKYTCEMCGTKTAQMHPHHIFSVGRHSTRYEPDNGICLCASHHNWRGAHSTQYDIQKAYHEWMEGYKGVEFLEALKAKSHIAVRQGISVLEEIAADLENKIADLDK